ncbi:uncharacterized protein LOC142364255 [Opisthocomus hoazin]|uniref:uncharacterized protein LOC142364255 n=1 Tax=Opisthocomus hoazin TaxID=30419 RepID=UPI003F52FCE9
MGPVGARTPARGHHVGWRGSPQRQAGPGPSPSPTHRACRSPSRASVSPPAPCRDTCLAAGPGRGARRCGLGRAAAQGTRGLRRRRRGRGAAAGGSSGHQPPEGQRETAPPSLGSRVNGGDPHGTAAPTLPPRRRRSALPRGLRMPSKRPKMGLRLPGSRTPREGSAGLLIAALLSPLPGAPPASPVLGGTDSCTPTPTPGCGAPLPAPRPQPPRPGRTDPRHRADGPTVLADPDGTSVAAEASSPPAGGPGGQWDGPPRRPKKGAKPPGSSSRGGPGPGPPPFPALCLAPLHHRSDGARQSTAVIQRAQRRRRRSNGGFGGAAGPPPAPGRRRFEVNFDARKRARPRLMETGVGPGMRSPGGRSGQGDTAQAPPPRGAARRGRGAEVRDAAGGRPRSCRGVGRGFRGSRGDPCDRRLFSAEFEAERGAVARPPSRLPLGCWAPRDGESPRRRAQARSTRTFGTQRLSDASPARQERL